MAPAQFHDPSLFYRDTEKDRSANVIRQVNDNSADGSNKPRIVEKNPLLDTNEKGKWSYLTKML